MQLAYIKVPTDNENIIELTSTLASLKPRPIAIPIEREIANANIKPVAFPQENPDRTKVAPRETEAAK